MSTLLAPEVKETPEPPKPEPKAARFRVTNVGRLYFPDGMWFDFNKPIMAISNPDLIAKLTKLTELPKAHVFIIEN